MEQAPTARTPRETYIDWVNTRGYDAANALKLAMDEPAVSYVLKHGLDPWEHLQGALVSGANFRRLFPGVNALKFIHDRMEHFGMTYDHAGNYVDFRPLHADDHCHGGGLYFALENDTNCVKGTRSAYSHARHVHLDADCMVYLDPYSDYMRNKKYKVDKFRLGERIDDIDKYIWNWNVHGFTYHSRT